MSRNPTLCEALAELAKRIPDDYDARTIHNAIAALTQEEDAYAERIAEEARCAVTQIKDLALSDAVRHKHEIVTTYLAAMARFKVYEADAALANHQPKEK